MTPARSHPGGERGCTVWLTGLPGAGKTTLANLVSANLRSRGLSVEVLDGDMVRRNVSAGLGFSKADRDTNVRRIGFVAELLSRNGVVVIVAAISPYRAVRDEVRQRIGRFLEVYVRCAVETLAARDRTGLYSRARTGEIPQFTGISDPYEEPLAADVVVDTDGADVADSVSLILDALDRSGLLP